MPSGQMHEMCTSLTFAARMPARPDIGCRVTRVVPDPAVTVAAEESMPVRIACGEESIGAWGSSEPAPPMLSRLSP